MNAKWQEYFKLYAKTEEYVNALRRSEEIIESQFDESAYVSYSGGKDSIAVLHLVSSQRDNFRVFHFVAGRYLIPKKLENEVLSNLERIAPNANPCIARFRLGGFESSRSEKFTKNWYGAFYSSLAAFKNKTGCTRGFLGLRTEESLRRRRKMKIQLGGGSDVYPIKHWSWRTVWAYIVSNNLPYPSSYDSYAELLGYENARFVSFFDAEFDKLGSTNIDNVLMWREKHVLRHGQD